MHCPTRRCHLGPEVRGAGSPTDDLSSGVHQTAIYHFGRPNPETHFTTLDEALAKFGPPFGSRIRDVTPPDADPERTRKYAFYRGDKLAGFSTFSRTPAGWVLGKGQACNTTSGRRP